MRGAIPRIYSSAIAKGLTAPSVIRRALRFAWGGGDGRVFERYKQMRACLNARVRLNTGADAQIKTCATCIARSCVRWAGGSAGSASMRAATPSTSREVVALYPHGEHAGPSGRLSRRHVWS